MNASLKDIVPVTIDTVRLADPAERVRLTPAARNAIVTIAEFWALTAHEAAVVFGLSRRTWQRIKNGTFSTFNQDQMTRASLMIGLFGALEIAFSQPLSRDWVKIRREDPDYAGQTPLEVMIKYGIPAMLAVRNHAEAIRAAA